MMSRSTTTTLAGRSSSMRRMRRRASSASPSRIFCGTNGCPSFLEIDPTTGVATCAICGFTRRTH
jgi:hypothetical protein